MLHIFKTETRHVGVAFFLYDALMYWTGKSIAMYKLFDINSVVYMRFWKLKLSMNLDLCIDFDGRWA